MKNIFNFDLIYITTRYNSNINATNEIRSDESQHRIFLQSLYLMYMYRRIIDGSTKIEPFSIRQNHEKTSV